MDPKKLPHLTDEQRAALQAQPNQPLHIIDINSNNQYVVLPVEDYRHYQALFETDQFDISETYPAQEQSLSKVWDDPTLDDYNDYGNHRTDS